MASIGPAVVGPVLAVCFLLVFDVVIYVTAWQRLNQAAASLAQTVVAAGSLHEADFRGYFADAQRLAEPSDVSARGATIITALQTGGQGPPEVIWRRSVGAVAAVSNQTITLPRNLHAAQGDTLIATELSAPLTPWVLGARLLGGLVPSRLRGEAWQLVSGTALSQVSP
jgi:Flp pilus assembly protein TadG